MNQERVAFANSLRGIAALMVLVAHYAGSYWFARDAISTLTGLPVVSSAVDTPTIASWITLSVIPFNLGPLGVALFFLISGFVIPFAFVRQNRLQFLVGRIFRLWPVYFVGFGIGVATLAISSYFFETPLPFDARSVAIHSILGMREITGIPSIDGIVWTLEVEVKFYVIAMIAAPLLAAGSAFSFAIPALIFICCAFASQHLPAALFTAAPYLIFMFLGVAFNFYFRGLQSALATGLAAVSIGCAAYFLPGNPPLISIIAPNYALAVFIFCGCMALSKFLPETRIVKFLAQVSYPLYVLHALVGYTLMTVMLAIGIPSWATLLLTAFSAVLLAWAVHVLVEAPSIDLGRKLFPTVHFRERASSNS